MYDLIDLLLPHQKLFSLTIQHFNSLSQFLNLFHSVFVKNEYIFYLLLSNQEVSWESGNTTFHGRPTERKKTFDLLTQLIHLVSHFLVAKKYSRVYHY